MIVKKILTRGLNFFRDSFAAECFVFWKKLRKYNASVNTDEDREKMEYTLLRENHVIEKGMSMRFPKIGFGQEKVTVLCLRLMKYKRMYFSVNPNFLIYPLSTIKKYIDYTKNNGIAISEIEKMYNELTDGLMHVEVSSGIETVTRNELTKPFDSFEVFVKARHSIRYFKREVPSQELIEKALFIAQRTPSACNRQGWKVHVFEKEKCQELWKWQGGARGFEDEPTMAFLVTANMKAFLHYEPFQSYVDGGMYAMSLIYALHSVGLGTIPLSCGFHYHKLRELINKFNIPQNEVPIEIIACGMLEDKFNIAVSTRKNISDTTIYH